jgi:hypothetical protein
MFDYLISSWRKRSRLLTPFNNKVLNTLDKLKKDLLADPQTMEEHQFLVL